MDRFDHAKARPMTTRMLEMMHTGEMDALVVATMCLGWLDESSVKEMMQANDIATTDEDEEDVEDEVEEDNTVL